MHLWCVCNINQRLKDLQAKKATMKFLMGVNDVFSQVRTQILLMDPLPSINKAHSLFIQEEMQRSVTNSVRVESTVLATKSSSKIQKERKGLYAPTVESWVILWINVTNFMVFHQVTNSRTGI